MEKFGFTIRLSFDEAETTLKALRYKGQLEWKGDDFRESPDTILSVLLHEHLEKLDSSGTVEFGWMDGRKAQIKRALGFVAQNHEAILGEMVAVEDFENTEEFRDLQRQTGEGSMPPQPPLTREALELAAQAFVEECQNLRAQF